MRNPSWRSGRIITTEFEPSKTARARKDLPKAALIDVIDFVEIHEGDTLETLARDLPETLDLVLLDGASLYADILNRVETRLQPGALVIADDARAEFISHMCADANRYLSVPVAGDLEMSMQLF